MNKKLKEKTTLISLSIVLGVLLSLQIKQNISGYNLVSLNSIYSVKNEIDNSESEIKNLKKLITEKDKELNKFKTVKDGDNGEIEKYVQKEMKHLKFIGGLEGIKGSGIKIVIADNEEKEIVGQSIQDDIIHDSEIQIILNDLKNAGAEAISINGQRVLSNSEIKCGGPIIRINRRSSTNPFVIMAIGDPKSLYASINAPHSFGWTLREVYNKKVNTEMKDNILIPKYIQDIKEGD